MECSLEISYGIAEDIGFRPSMEDAHAIYDVGEQALFSAEVYDGHSGKGAAILAAEMVTPHVLASLKQARVEAAEATPDFLALLRDAFLATDRYITDRGVEGGTAAATLHIVNDIFFAANVGDSRVVIGAGRDGVQLTLDHKPDVIAERSRIESLGGWVSSAAVARVQGILAMSRALGDTQLKPYVSAEPRIVQGLLGIENDYAVIACDGVWDVLTPRDAIRIARESVQAQNAAERIVAEALACGSTDNVTVIVVDLRRHTAKMERAKMEIVAILDRAYD